MAECVDEVARDMALSAITAWGALVATIAFTIRDNASPGLAVEMLDQLDAALVGTVRSAQGLDYLRKHIAAVRDPIQSEDSSPFPC